MIGTKQRIARDLHRLFSELGFASPGVEALRAGANVSIRTLYKHFPSREAMVIGALEHRDVAYFNWLEGGPSDGADHVLHPLVRLGDWLHTVANTGCLFLNAMAEHPDSAAIANVVKAHKAKLANEFQIRLCRVAPNQDTQPLAETLFLLHEGLTEVARLQTPTTATAAALHAARRLLSQENIT
ncbi:TetR/AcrR family transcriptional regulator [Shimia sp. R10_1]|uniref:TetR/AcrR family transcriptional regulator n=1 Tax=Shimia sp. R10_1 TaxID=2821095 RepID=UPI001ADC5476|nr:TetR/AcrR family transcriptional regulator [Shimia sp. R10_1]MBO9475405.1 TetR/AcrR family transcriptional regulator [Shimia sp. R10_1]